MSYYPDGSAAEDEPTVWPAAPADARLAYAGVLIGEVNFRHAGDAGGSMGDRLIRWIAGLDRGSGDVVQLLRPQSGLVDSSGRILVTDAGLQGVMVFDERQATLDVWSDAGDNLSLHTPVGIAAGPDDQYYVADAELGYVVVMSSQGEAIGKLGADRLVRPTGLAVDPATGNLYVADTAGNDIKVFRGGQHVATLGGPGTRPGEFNGPTHLSFRQGRLYVTDTLNARVQVLTPSGDPVAEIGQRGLFVGNLVRPKGVTTDPQGNIYVIESYFDHLLIFDTEGRLLLPIGGSGDGVGQFFLPAGAWSDDDGRIFVADMFNGRVVVLRAFGG